MSSKKLVVLETLEEGVRSRYAAASHVREESLCCPVEYNKKLLEVIPQEIIERDYGCGDPSPYVKLGDTVLDLGSGGGKMCCMTAQLVGPTGKVIGVDFNPPMLELARRYQSEVADRLGYANVEFRQGLIQDLKLNLDLLNQKLADHPVKSARDWIELRSLEATLRQTHPLVENDSVDCVISNCVLNLVRQQDRQQLFAEIFRVLKNGGRAAIGDIVADEDVPERLQQNPELWSGCISGAFREDKFIEAFAQAGFHGMQIVSRQQDPWRVVDGIQFRSMTVVAYKGKQGPCYERNQAVIYQGPFKQVEDDDGHTFTRGSRIAVCDKLFKLLQKEPYKGQFIPVEPLVDIPLEEAKLYDCCTSRIREPSETKRSSELVTIALDNSSCLPGSGCCP